ncbi:MAG: TGS domain-containing protein [Candidatus Pacebacteria bacterium]|nr:TGS domain-containing protein [Candidatus Paceibacterota bacterium]
MQNLLKNLKRKFNSPELFEQIILLSKKADFRPFEPEKPIPNAEQLLFKHALRVGEILAAITSSKEIIIAGIIYQFKNPDFPQGGLSENIKQEISWIVSLAKRVRESLEIIKEPKARGIKDWQKVLFDQQAENIRKLSFALAKDIRPILVLIADELDELEHLSSYYSQNKRKKLALIDLEIMSPLCYGFGLENIKTRFEDAAFPILYPKEYKWLGERIEKEYKTAKALTEKTKPKIQKILQNNGLKDFEIFSRTKGKFSFYQKLLKHEMDFSKVYDLVALRIIVPTVEACYQTLGILHQNFQPLANRTKDYIGKPKNNGYRALHTTVESPEKKVFEIQIKTPQMHLEAEYGVAAHLTYKGEADARVNKKSFWLEKIRQWKEEAKKIEGISPYIEKGIFKNRIFVLTPKGDLINLPNGATPVDFAFAVHSDIGEHAEGALVNEKIVPLDYKLKDGEKVEIIINKNRTPSEKWLRFVKTQKAKNKISKFLETSLGQAPLSKTQAAVSAITEKVALIKKIIPSRFIKKPQILIAGETGIAFKLAKCCSPKTGDRISAFIDQGEGASVHKANCPNLLELKQKWPERIVPAQWV